jgi:hypothetical protein
VLIIYHLLNLLVLINPQTTSYVITVAVVTAVTVLIDVFLLIGAFARQRHFMSGFIAFTVSFFCQMQSFLLEPRGGIF